MSVLPDRNTSLVGGTIRNDAIVLRTQQVGEADLWLLLLTKEYGIRKAVVKQQQENGDISAAAISLWSIARFELGVRHSSDRVLAAELIAAYAQIYVRNYDCYQGTGVVCQVAESSISESIENSEVPFLLVASALKSMATAPQYVTGIVLTFLLRTLQVVGWNIMQSTISLSEVEQQAAALLLEANWQEVEQLAPGMLSHMSTIVTAYFESCTEIRLKPVPLVENL